MNYMGDRVVEGVHTQNNKGIVLQYVGVGNVCVKGRYL